MHGFLPVLGGLPRAATILRVLAATGLARAGIKNHLPSRLTPELHKVVVMGLVDEKLTALETGTTENLHQKLEELCIIHRTRELIMTEVAGTIVVVLTTCTAYFPVLQYTHAGIKEAS